MKPRLCPKCGQFALNFKPGYMGQGDAYVCFCCGAVIPSEEASLSMDEDSMQRFPGVEQPGKDSLSTFLERKKS